jgi:Leucine-rich repeat (LRR) protein
MILFLFFLARLELENNTLVGEIPASVYALPLLRNLYLNDNPGIVGTIPTQIRLQNLKELRLGSTGMGGDLPEQIYTLPKIVELNLASAKFSGTLSERFALLNTTLQYVNLKDNQFTGPIPQAFDVIQFLGKCSRHSGRSGVVYFYTHFSVTWYR